MTLHLPLKERWFRMIQSGEKKEEYREITPYWMKRLMNCYSSDRKECVAGGCARIIDGKPSCNGEPWRCFTKQHCYPLLCYNAEVEFTLGYPKSDDADRHTVKRIKEIAIGTGRPEWGAEPGKEYFVIKLED